MKKIFIATPAYSGKVNAQYAISLSETVCFLTHKGYQIQMYIPTCGSLLCSERNRILMQFIKSDATHILCIDADLGWPAQDVERMLLRNLEFIGGVYPARHEKTFMSRPLFNEDGSLKTDGLSLIEMECIPAGFMLIKREVIQKMMDDNQDRYYKPKQNNGPDGFALFNTELFDGEFWGEDFIFCKLVAKSGFKIWVDPMIQFDHDGNIGCLAQVMTNKKEEAAIL